MRELVIIGAGPAGLTAAIYARRAGIDVLVCEGGMYGGQLVNTEIIKNYPSYKSVEGWELARNMYLQAEECGAEFLYESVLDVCEKDGIFTVKTDSGEIECRAVIIANGSKRLKIGCKGSDRYEGLGVSYCASCDGQLYKGQPVAVVGGGENAFEDALYLSALCTKVHLCAKKITASEETVNTAKEKDNIIIYEGYYPAEIYGETRVTGLIIADKENNTADIPAAAVFTALGQTRDNAIFAKIVVVDDSGYIIASEDCSTDTKGVWAAGDTRTKPLRQIVTAASDGATAATAAAAYIIKKRKSK